MPTRGPDFATLSMATPSTKALVEASYEAAERLIEHLDFRNCHHPEVCDLAKGYRADYRAKKAAALKAIRKESKGGRA